ncbi:MAG: hypothetical protein ACR2NU_14360 [Aeoliella sp.]
MRFSIKSLLVLLTVSAVVLALGRYFIVSWPDVTLSVANGLAVWIFNLLALKLIMTEDLPRLIRAILMPIATLLIWMIAFRYSPSLLALMCGFFTGATGTWVVTKYGPRVLAWSGVESD